MDDEEEELMHSHVQVRPYAADPMAVDAPPPVANERRIFRPRPPTERRRVERAELSSAAPFEETAQALLQGALRRQDYHATSPGGFGVPFVPERFKGMALSKFGVSESGRVLATTPTVFGSGAGGPGGAAPRQMKAWKEGKSMELLDLAFTPMRRTADGGMRRHYPPISLPYFNVTEDDHAPAEGGSSGSTTGPSAAAKKGRPTLHMVDEGNSNAARELFLNPDGDLKEDNFFLIQLPSVLPELVDHTEEVQREEDVGTPAAAATINRLPDGLLGKLKIHKSGKVRMEIGGLPFCVDQGCTTFFQQDLACVCPLAKEIVNLGAIHNRVVLTPDVGAILAEMAKAGPPGGASKDKARA